MVRVTYIYVQVLQLFRVLHCTLAFPRIVYMCLLSHQYSKTIGIACHSAYTHTITHAGLISTQANSHTHTYRINLTFLCITSTAYVCWDLLDCRDVTLTDLFLPCSLSVFHIELIHTGSNSTNSLSYTCLCVCVFKFYGAICVPVCTVAV